MAGNYNSIGKMAREKGQSVEAFAKGNIHADGLVGKLARMYFYSTGVHGGGGASMATGGDKPRSAGERLYQIG